MVSGKLFVISAPSGTGKTSLVNALLQNWAHEHQLKKVVTYTTRVGRPSEVDGKDYHFISREEFEKKQQEGFFLESGLFCGHYYGSPLYVVDPLYRKQNSYVLVIDRLGGIKIKEMEGVVLIWIMPPSLEELRIRLEKRSKDSIDEIDKRIKKAQEELEYEERENTYTYSLMNDDFLKAQIELNELIGAVIDGLEKETNKEVSINFLRKCRPAR